MAVSRSHLMNLQPCKRLTPAYAHHGFLVYIASIPGLRLPFSCSADGWFRGPSQSIPSSWIIGGATMAAAQGAPGMPPVIVSTAVADCPVSFLCSKCRPELELQLDAHQAC